jgi:hypothetical protein
MPLSGTYPFDEDAAITEVRTVARRRADLLAQFAGTSLGLSLTQPVDQLAVQLVAQASLAARAGADMDAVGRYTGGCQAWRGHPCQPPALAIWPLGRHDGSRKVAGAVGICPVRQRRRLAIGDDAGIAVLPVRQIAVGLLPVGKRCLVTPLIDVAHGG